jgi:two pore calcium channel protein 1/two pore calcium channel protein 3
VLFDYVLYNIVSGFLVQSLKANRVLRIAKIQKVFRMFRALRSIKIVGFLFSGLEILDNVRNLIYKIMICVPVILRLLVPIQIIFFLYASVGVHLFSGLQPNNDYSPQECHLSGTEKVSMESNAF